MKKLIWNTKEDMKMDRKYYAEIRRWGADSSDVISFPSKKEREAFIRTTDFTSSVRSTDPRTKGCPTYKEFVETY